VRYTAEFRGGDNYDNDWEWCVVDEYIGPVGSTILLDLTEEEAKLKAKELNEKEQYDKQ
jgi:hypothetical protein